MKAILAAAYLRRQAEQRERKLRSEIQKVKQRMARRRFEFLSQVVALVAQDKERNGPRLKIERCVGGWRGSSVAGYLRSAHDSVYYSNFRMDKKTFSKLITLLKGTPFASETVAVTKVPGKRIAHRRSAAHIAFARAHTDPPTTRFKLGVCLYAMAHGGPFKVIGDAAGIGKSTVRKWMAAFCDAVMTAVKPIYMPAQPHTPSELDAIRAMNWKCQTDWR